MRTRKRNQGAVSTQLCLFDEAQMAAMQEVRQPVKAPRGIHDQFWLLWQLEILSGLTGKYYRDQRAMLTGRVKPVLPRVYSFAISQPVFDG